MNGEQLLLRRIKRLTWFFIVGLIISGATAIPLVTELDWLVNWTGARRLVEAPASTNAPDWALWLVKVQTALLEVTGKFPFLAYGTDWLAFGHFVIALAFVGALRDPIRNRWLYRFGMPACALVPAWALVFGAIRGIPLWWRLIDAAFGVAGFVPAWLCHRWTGELDAGGARSRDAA